MTKPKPPIDQTGRTAYEAFQPVRFPDCTTMPWDHPAVAKARPAWAAVEKAVTAPVGAELALLVRALHIAAHEAEMESDAAEAKRQEWLKEARLQEDTIRAEAAR